MDKILLIDDSIIVGDSLKAILETDYDVTVCHDAESGLENAMSGKYSLILMDIIMPDMDGFTLLKKLQDMILTRYILIIVVTGLTDIQHEEEALTLGAVDYITKPVIPAILKARINAQLRSFDRQMHYKKLAMVDELTGIANRRRYEEEWRMKWREALRLGIPFSVCIFDIDKFKIHKKTGRHCLPGSRQTLPRRSVPQSPLHGAGRKMRSLLHWSKPCRPPDGRSCRYKS